MALFTIKSDNKDSSPFSNFELQSQISNMKEDSGSDRQQYNLPRAQLPRIPIVYEKSISQSLYPVPNSFQSSSLTIDPKHSIQSLQFLTDQTFFAAGLSNGTINIVSSAQGNTQYILKGSDTPVSGLAHNPDSKHIRHALLATHTDGTLEYWHATSRQLLFSKKYDQMLQTCEISPEGTHYAFSGQLGNIKLGNLNKGDPSELQIGHIGSHDNRVYCLKWNPKDNNIFLSGGWDKTVYFWDIRLKTAIKKLFGYYMGGQSIDFKDNEILLGNNLSDFPLRIYDSQADKVRAVDWKWTIKQQAHHTTGVVSCFYGAQNTIIAVTPRNQLRLFKNEKLISEHIQNQEGLRVYCMQNNTRQNKILSGWNNGTVKWFNY